MLDIMAKRIMHSRCNIESTQKLYSFVKNRRTYRRAFDLSRHYCVKAVKSTLAQLTVVYKHKQFNINACVRAKSARFAISC